IRITALRPDPGFNDHGPPTTYYHLFTGQGWTAGLDITAVYKIKKTDIVLSYTLSKIQEKYDQVFHGDYFSPQEDRRHQLKLSGNYQFGPVMLGGLVTYKSKAPYVSFVRVEEHGGGGIDMTDPQSALQYLPEYFSLDLSADYAFDFFKSKAQLGVSLINATDHANIQEIQHTGRVSRDNMGGLYITQQTELLGRTWNAHVKLVF
ncbi:MAG TPA: hypothetical protein VJ508_03930, partial [Saprospiraceae bacterium]|nr:hypothetical protein [Saprospiraceae bacterium]